MAGRYFAADCVNIIQRKSRRYRNRRQCWGWSVSVGIVSRRAMHESVRRASASKSVAKTIHMIHLGIGDVTSEKRESGTAVVLSALLSSVRGTGGGGLDANRASAVATAAQWWARTLASADVSPELPALDPLFLFTVGNDLARSSNSVWDFRVRPNGELVLLRANHWDVQGSADPASWIYKLELSGPTAGEVVRRSREAVLHFRLAGDSRRPWIGLSPIGWASLTGRLNGALETSLGHEASGPVGSLIPLAEGTEATSDFKDSFNKLAGETALLETTAGGGGDMGQAPRRDWIPARLGPNTPQAMVMLRDQVEACVLALFGVSPALTTSVSDGTKAREDFRRLIVAVCRPIGKIVAAELMRVIELPFVLRFGSLRAIDLQGSARSVASLVAAGMDLSEARKIAGLDD